tara:strand:- start:330 stop:476 length:147 start_codon:yes stop_codon:yes gene_type:complete
MQFNIKLKLLKEIDRRKLRQFKIETKYRLMKASTGGNEKYRREYNKKK